MMQNPPRTFISSSEVTAPPEGYVPVVVGTDPVARVFGIEQALVAGYVLVVNEK